MRELAQEGPGDVGKALAIGVSDPLGVAVGDDPSQGLRHGDAGAAQADLLQPGDRQRRGQIRAPLQLAEQRYDEEARADEGRYGVAGQADKRGTVNHAPVYPREVVKRALDLQASALILVHNHPSGDPTPSPEDVQVTRQIVEAGSLLNIDVLDHLIIGRQRFVSMKERGLGFR